MEIREVTVYNKKKAPFSGYGIWLVFEMKYRQAQLLHPVHLTELILGEYDFVRSSGNCLWPVNNTGNSFDFERFRKSFKERVELFVKNKKYFPVQLVANAIAELDECSYKEALTFLASHSSKEYNKPVSTLFNKANREYNLAENVDLLQYKGRQLVILNAFKENGQASIYQITHLVTGKLKTKSDVGRVVTYFIHKFASQGVLEIVA
jgi:hypothetical protein